MTWTRHAVIRGFGGDASFTVPVGNGPAARLVGEFGVPTSSTRFKTDGLVGVACSYTESDIGFIVELASLPRMRRNMATARLINPATAEGGTAYEVDTYPFNQRPFTGPGDRNWASFTLVRGQGARYEWRTGADAVREAARKVVAATWTLSRAMREPFVAGWLDRHGGDFISTLRDDEPGLADLPAGQLALTMLLEEGQHLTNKAGPLGYYSEEDDQYLRDAAECLDLPRWARVRLADSGGPGTGFTAASIWVKAGKTLEDLGMWLARLTGAPEGSHR